MARSAPIKRPVAERFVAWLYTGPLGNLWSAVADIVVLWTRWMAGRARERISRA